MSKNYFNIQHWSERDLASASMNDILHKTAKQASELKEAIILEQLSELINRGLLIIEETQPLLTINRRCEDKHGVELKMSQGIRLVLKDQEHIEKLEKENAELKKRLDKIMNYLDDPMDID